MDTISAFISSLEVGTPVGTPDLTLFPLTVASAAEPNYDTLKNAIGAGHVRVTEISATGSVPELRVENRGARPVLIVDGEELVGAKQNRIVNITILVPADTTLSIPVSCVEAGRWAMRTKEFAPAGRAFHASGRRAKVAQVSASLRNSSSRHADQFAIWAEIDAKSARMGATSDTRAAAAMFELKHEQLEALASGLQPADGQVGAVFAIRGAIVGLDAFDSPPTWAAAMAGLVRSYGLDALDALEGGNVFAKPDPRAFLDAIAAAAVDRFPAVGLGSDLRVDGKGVVGGSLLVGERIIHLVAFPTEGAMRPGDTSNEL